MYRVQWKLCCLTVLWLFVGSLARSDEIATQIVRVDAVSKMIHFQNDVVAEVGVQSRLFDRDGSRLELQELAKQFNTPKDVDGSISRPLLYATFEAVDVHGRVVIDELHLVDTPR